MKRKDFIKQTGLLLGALPAAGTISLAASLHKDSATTFDPMNWTSIRGQFPLTRSYIHMATFLIASHPRPVAEAIERHRNAFDENPAFYFGEHFMTAEAEQREAAAEYLGANPDHIALTDSTTMGLGLIYGTLKLQPGQEIVTTTHDHYSTEMSIRHRAGRTGALVRQISLYDNPANASIDQILTRIRDAITPQTRALAVTWVHSNTGVKLPIARMAKVLQEINASRETEERVLFCVDGVHGLGIENVTVDELGCDFLIAGTHKWLFGPRGTGIIWGRPEAWDAVAPVVPSFGPDYGVWLGFLTPEEVPVGEHFTPGGFHSFEHRWALGKAFRFHSTIGKARVQERIHALNTLTKEALAELPYVRLHTPISPDLSAGMVCFGVEGYSPDQVVDKLLEKGVIASTTPYR